MPKHYKLSPSASARWLACPGSLSLKAPYDTGGESVYAAEGTQAHKLCEMLVWSRLKKTKIAACKTADYPPEMLAAANVFADYCQSAVQPAGHWSTENTVESTIFPDHGGTMDFYAVSEDEETAVIVDFKYGVGVPVAAERNPQLLCYAGLLLEQVPSIQQFTLAIVQPRTAGPAVDEWVTTREKVLAFREKVIWASNHPEDFYSGDHCRWCPALTVCPTVQAEAFAVAGLEFEEVAADENRWAELMRVAPAISAMLKAIPEKMLPAMRAGRKFEGFKAVESVGNRSWINDEKTTLAKLSKRKLGVRVATVRKLKTPTQMDREGYGEQIAGLFERPSRGQIVAPITDRRPEIVFESAEDTFQDLSFLE